MFMIQLITSGFKAQSSMLIVVTALWVQTSFAQLDSVRGYLVFRSESIRQAYATKVTVHVYNEHQQEIRQLHANESGYFAFKLADTYQDSVLEVGATGRIVDQKKIDSICPCVYNLNCRGFFDSQIEVMKSMSVQSKDSNSNFKDFKTWIQLRMNEAFCPFDTSYFYIKDQKIDTGRADFKMKLTCLNQRFTNALKFKKEKLIVHVFLDSSSVNHSSDFNQTKLIELFLKQFESQYGQFEINFNPVIFPHPIDEQSIFMIHVDGLK